MRGKADGNGLSCRIGQLLLNLRRMAVDAYPVCLDIFIYLTLQAVYFRASSCPGGAGLGVNDQCIGINDPFFH